MRRTTLIALIMVHSFAYAGDAENILACVKKAKEFSGITLSEFDAVYQGNIMALSTAQWANVHCEVKFGEVYNLKVNGNQVIVNRFAGKASYDLNTKLEVRTEAAINQLKSRIALLEQRMGQVSVSLKKPKPNHAWLTRYIDEGIEKATGAQRLEAAPAKESQMSQSSQASLPKQPAQIAKIYYVNENVLDERLGPSHSASVTNRIYRRQKVEVFETQNGWARVSKYYDGDIEGKSGQVARWVLASGLSHSQPTELPQPSFANDSRIAKDAFPKVGENNLTEEDIKILYEGAVKYLNSGKCAGVELGDKSTSKANTYYINCGGSNIFFTPSDLL